MQHLCGTETPVKRYGSQAIILGGKVGRSLEQIPSVFTIQLSLGECYEKSHRDVQGGSQPHFRRPAMLCSALW